MLKRILEKLFKLEPDVCMNCETLRGLLEAERNERNTLTQALIETTRPRKEEPTIALKESIEPVNTTNYMPWRVRRNMLEQEDRQKARIVKQHTEQLEAAVGIKDATGTEATSAEN